MTMLIYGAGNTGQALLHYLWRHASIFLLDRDAALVERLSQTYDIVAHCGDLSDVEFLSQVWQSPSPHVLVAVTDQPESNLLAAYMGQSMVPDLRVIARVDAPTYHTKAHDSQLHGFHLFSPYRIVSHALIELACRPDCLDFATIDGEDQDALEVRAVRLHEHHPWCGLTVQDLVSQGIDVARIVYGDKAWVPQRHDRLTQGQCVYAVCPTGLTELIPQEDTPLSHVLVGVDGAIVPWLLQGLADLDVDVTVVCHNSHDLDWAATHWPRCRLVQGDMTMPSILGPEITTDTVMISASTRPTDNIAASAIALGCGARHAVTWVHHHLGPEILSVQGAGSLVPTGPRVLSHVLSCVPRTQRMWIYPLLGGVGGALVNVVLNETDPVVMGRRPDLVHDTCRLLATNDWRRKDDHGTTLVAGQRITLSVMNEGLDQLWTWLNLDRHDDSSEG